MPEALWLSYTSLYSIMLAITEFVEGIGSEVLLGYLLHLEDLMLSFVRSLLQVHKKVQRLRYRTQQLARLMTLEDKGQALERH